MMKFSLYFQIAFITICSLSCFILVFIVNNESTSFSNQQQQQQAKKKVLEEARNKSENENENNYLFHFTPNKLYSNDLIDEVSVNYIKNEKYKNKLLHLNDLSYLLEPKNEEKGDFNNKPEVHCSNKSNDSTSSYELIIFINSKWNNFKRRQYLRDSWLNKSNILNSSLCFNINIKKIRWFFALGLSKKQYLSNRIDQKVIDEFKLYGDILVINLYERYRDMSTKHLSVYKWLLDNSEKYTNNNNNVIVLKSDDDNKINLNQLERENIQLILKHEYSNSNWWLMCALFPEGRKTIRMNKSKWSLTFEEYPYETLPAYCSGLAYLMPLVLIKRLYIVAHLIEKQEHKYNNRPLWIDDLYITGIVRSSLFDKVNILNAINTYCFTKEQTNLKYHTKMNECTFLDLEMYNS